MRSMTAFANEACMTPWGRLECLVRAVNHRYCEIGMRVSPELQYAETAFRESILHHVRRGKIDLTMRLCRVESPQPTHVDLTAVAQWGQLTQKIQQQIPQLHVSLQELMHLPGVCQPDPVDEQQLQSHAATLLAVVLDRLIAARETEGAQLARGITERIHAIARLLRDIRLFLPEVRHTLKEKWLARMTDYPEHLEAAQMEHEWVASLHKMDVDEELERLTSHLNAIRTLVGESGVIGRRLDFLLQECHREANTLGAKSVDVRTSAAAVDLKVLIDQLREQSQNIE